MEVIPAIDLRGGQCVRLRQGDYNQETVFGADPAAMAERWANEGATRIHLVDLDGARAGKPVNTAAVQAILSRVQIPCQLGGGVRDEQTINTWLEAGIDRVIIGTQALKDALWFEAMAERYPKRLTLGLDARDDQVATDGWLDVSSVDVMHLARRFQHLPLASLVYTDISRDGMLSGPNMQLTATLAEQLTIPVIASGGVSTLADLRELSKTAVAGCIVGVALYSGQFTLADAIMAAKNDGPERMAESS